MTDTVQAPTVEAVDDTKAPKSTGDKIAAAMAKPVPEFHVDFVNWLADHDVEDIDVRSVQATMSLYNVFRTTDEFKAKREAAKANKAATVKAKATKPVSEMTDDEKQAEAAKIIKAQQAAKVRAEQEAKRLAEIQQLLAQAGITMPTAGDEAPAEDTTVDADEATAEAF